MNLPNLREAGKRTKSPIKFILDDYKLPDNLKELGLNKKYYIKTYGCQMNVHDTENIKAILEMMSFKETDEFEEADLILLNTCAIRENAHNKMFGFLGRVKHLKESKPHIVTAICGCMAQEENVVEALMKKYKWVDIVFGTHNIHRLPYILNEALEKNKLHIEVLSREGNIVEGIPVKRQSNYKAYVNIIYGCDKFCTYCIVPYTRGKQRSRDPKDIVREVEELVKDGYKEVTLLGQNVNAYGKDFDYEYTMENLLEDVSKTAIPRIFFMTSHPWDFTDGMIDVISRCENVMPYVHMPVQSGSSRILKLMGRRYTKESYLELFDKIRERIPRVSISTDIIVGFPGEEEEDFLDTLELAEHCKYDNAFTFIYSPRENTAAAKLTNQVLESVKEERLQRLNAVVNKYFLENNKKLVCKEFPVLVEGISSKKNELFGYTDTFKLINFEGDSSLIGEIVNVKVVDAKTWSLDGEIVK